MTDLKDKFHDPFDYLDDEKRNSQTLSKINLLL